MNGSRQRITGLAVGVASILALAWPGVAHSSERSADALAPKSLVIGMDGASYDRFAAAGLPEVTSLQSQGLTATSNLYAEPMAPTLSGPGWSTIGSGVWPDKHKVRDNNFTGAQFGTYPDYLTRIETAKPTLRTEVVATWAPVATTVFGSAVDSRIQGGTDAGTEQAAQTALAGAGPDSLFVHFDDIDHAGHSYGAASPEYAAALRATDTRIRHLVDTVRARPTYGQESWLIVLTADHGHTAAGGHGGNTAPERKTFVIAVGPGITAGSTRSDIKLVDISASVLAHHGIARNPAWGLDGSAFADVSADSFDGLRGTLQGRVDETGIDAGIRGFTHTTPSGWSIDNSAMPTGGVTEWRGWSFSTDEFWTAAQLGQGRETNVRARNVFAVADSDEWDDKTHGTGQFDSTLVGPKYAVTGLTKLTLKYATTYAIDGPQSAQVLVSFNGGTPTVVKSYTAATNNVESVAVALPSGTTTAQFRFRYTGQNSAFWTLDQVRVFGS